jgi:hypothetical protein
MAARDRFRGGAGLAALLSQSNEFADLLEREAELTASQDEGQPAPVLRAIDPMAPPVRSGGESNPIRS